MNINEYAEQAKANFDAHEAVTERARMEIPARDLKAGDQLVIAAVRVESARMGNSRVIVKVEGRKTETRLLPDETVTVSREVETEESKAARDALYAEWRAALFLADRAGEPNLTALNEALAKGWMKRVAEEAVAIEAGRLVRAMLNGYGERVAEGKFTALEAVGHLRSDLERKVMSSSFGQWSGGHTVHNAVEQGEFEACRKLWDDLKWM